MFTDCKSNLFVSLILCDPGKNVFEFRNVTSAEMVSVLKKMKVSKSSGLDKISSKLLKAAGNSIIESLTYLFNLVLNTGIFPDDTKFAKVTPIYKSGSKTDCGNYADPFQ